VQPKPNLPTAPAQDLEERAERVRKCLLLVSTAVENYLEHALATGDELIRNKAEIPHGGWLEWLRTCDLTEDTAGRFMRLARHRAELTANSARVRNLSLTAALKLIAKPKQDCPLSSSKAKKSSKPASSFDALAWWSAAAPEERRHFLDGVGSNPLLAAIPPTWSVSLEGQSPADATAWWRNAEWGDRRQFLNGVGLLAVLEAMPPEWRTEIERRVSQRKGEPVTIDLEPSA
jgi:hypothetical protein